MRRVLRSMAALTVLASAALAAAIAFGGPRQPEPLASISDPFKAVDYSDLPPAQTVAARDGIALAYHAYAAQGPAKGSAVIIHGSSARGNSVHALAKALAAGGYAAYAVDVRGHGDSGVRGKVAYIGQLEDDLEDLMKALKPQGKTTLVGFSSGGGFVLRFAADPRRALFDRYLLLAPFLSQDASTYRPNAGGWVSVGVPRVVALSILNSMGVKAWNDLPAIAFALRPASRDFLTGQYSFALASNFRPRPRYKEDIAAATQPMAVLVGSADELFIPQNFEPEFRAAGRPLPMTVVPGVGHIGLTLEPAAFRAALSALESLP